MERFVTVDLNGWLDHLVVGGKDGNGRAASALGFRSCLFQYRGTWLFGGQALAAARDERVEGPLLNAVDALAFAAGHGKCSREQRHALPDALWQLVSDVSRRSGDFNGSSGTTHLAVVVPDGRYFGLPKVIHQTGHTRLETLHKAIRERRPPELNGSRLELIWRSVAALHAARTAAPTNLGCEVGSALVISAIRRTFWTVLKLRHWPSEPPDRESNRAVHIARKPVIDECSEKQAWMAHRMELAQATLKEELSEDIDALRKWTRSVEIMASGMNAKSLEAFGMNGNAVEHWSWPTADGNWRFLRPRSTSSSTRSSASLPAGLEARLGSFAAGDEGEPLAIVFESPVGPESTVGFERLVRDAAPEIPVVPVAGWNAAAAALDLALTLGGDPEFPAWLDEVPSIELEVHRKIADDPGTDVAKAWMPVIREHQVIPAGETYRTPSEGLSRAVTLAPGIEHIHLHLRRGDETSWDYRYSGRRTGHSMLPSDRERTVEPLASVRPASGDARIEIVEHFPDGRTELLAGSRSSVRWSEMSAKAPAALRSIPELYVFKTSEEGWQGLRPLLEQVVDSGVGGVKNHLRDQLDKRIRKQWKEGVFPLGSDGEPPSALCTTEFLAAKRLLADSTAILLRDLEEHVRTGRSVPARVANRLHMPLTWLFTGCPEETVEILLRALLDPIGKEGIALKVDNEYSAWSIYSGIGRAVRGVGALKSVFDDLLGAWERSGGEAQDKFLLAAVTHPLARRVSVRSVLGESKERFDRVSRFLGRQLDNLASGISDTRPGGQRQPGLELRYVTMGYRGLCQLRYSHNDWFPPAGEQAKRAHDKLLQAKSLRQVKEFESNLVDLTVPYLIGEGRNPTMPGGF